MRVFVSLIRVRVSAPLLSPDQSTTQIIELLISESYDHINDPQVLAHTFCLEARGLVDDSGGSDDLAAAIKAKYKHEAAGGGGTRTAGTTGWRSSSRAKQAAKILTTAAVKCVTGANKRCTPTELLPELEVEGGSEAHARMREEA